MTTTQIFEFNDLKDPAAFELVLNVWLSQRSRALLTQQISWIHLDGPALLVEYSESGRMLDKPALVRACVVRCPLEKFYEFVATFAPSSLYCVTTTAYPELVETGDVIGVIFYRTLVERVELGSSTITASERFNQYLKSLRGTSKKPTTLVAVPNKSEITLDVGMAPDYKYQNSELIGSVLPAAQLSSQDWRPDEAGEKLTLDKARIISNSVTHGILGTYMATITRVSKEPGIVDSVEELAHRMDEWLL